MIVCCSEKLSDLELSKRLSSVNEVSSKSSSRGSGSSSRVSSKGGSMITSPANHSSRASFGENVEEVDIANDSSHASPMSTIQSQSRVSENISIVES